MTTPIPSFILFLTLISTIIESSSGSLDDFFSTPNKTSGLKKDFYANTCARVFVINVRKILDNEMEKNPGIAASMIQLHFLDCFVRGCDASILLDSTPGNIAEKEGASSSLLRAFEVIDEIKKDIEAECPQTVSCADIIASSASESSAILGRIYFKSEFGRRDGTISSKQEAKENLPKPFFDVNQLEKSFANKGLSLQEMVVLSGAHSVGVSHCSNFANRLYDFNGTKDKHDPSLDPTYASELRGKCPPGSKEGTMPLDFVTPNRLDNLYFRDVQQNKALLTSDQALMDNGETAKMVKELATFRGDWHTKFAEAMTHLGSIEVLTGDKGQIRKNCRVVN